MRKKIKNSMLFIVLVCIAFAGMAKIKAVQAKTAGAKTAQILGTVYRDGSVLFDGVTSATMTAKTPYFDLNQYGLGRYTLRDGNGSAVKKPTLLHGMIYLIEKCWLNAAESDLGTGKYKDAVLSVSQHSQVKYYAGEYTPFAITQPGGVMLGIDQQGMPTSLWGFNDHQMKIYVNQKLVNQGLHKILLEDLNVLEIMLISKDNKRTIMYPQFSSKCFHIKTGETAVTNVKYLDLDGNPFNQFTTKSLLVYNEAGQQIISETMPEGDLIAIGPLDEPGIYRANLIYYPFYFRQLIVVSDEGPKEDDASGDDDNSEKKPSDETPSKKDPKETPIQADKFKAEKITSLKAAKYKSSGVRLTWKKIPNADSYQVYRSMNMNKGYKLVKTVKGAKNAKYVLKKGLIKGAVYYYKVRGCKTVNGKKAYTPYTRICVNLNPEKAVKAIPIANLKAKAAKGNITLTWKKHESMYSLKGYKIYQSSRKNSGYRQVASVKGTKAVIKKSLKKGKTYYFKVQGYAKIGKKLVYTKAKIVKVKISK